MEMLKSVLMSMDTQMSIWVPSTSNLYTDCPWICTATQVCKWAVRNSSEALLSSSRVSTLIAVIITGFISLF